MLIALGKIFERKLNVTVQELKHHFFEVEDIFVCIFYNFTAVIFVFQQLVYIIVFLFLFSL